MANFAGPGAELFARLESSSLTKNHYKVISAAVLGDLREFFDFTLIAFVLTFVVKPWNLNYGETTIILLSSGVGAILGAVFWGRMADSLGRRPIFISTVLFFSIATAFMYFTPEGNWGYLTVFRFLTGFGVGGLYSIDLPLVQEFVPSKYRGRISGIITSFVPIGTMTASTLAAFITPMIGWRGLFLLGLIPAALNLLIRVWVPESPRWLIKNGRIAEAEAAVNWVTNQSHTFVHASEVSQVTASIDPAAKTTFKDLFRYKRSVATTWISNAAQQCAYYCFTMWGPTLIALVVGKTPQQAAKLFIAVTLGGFIGRWTWAFVSDAIGRRKTGVLLGIGAAVMLLLATLTTHMYIGTISVFWLCMIGIYFFADGGFALTGPYGTEPWPARLKATGMGSAYGMGGIGKIIGPMAVAVFAGSSNIVSPQATTDAIAPVYIFLAVIMVIMAITFYCALETKGKSIEEIEAILESEAS